MKLRDIKRIQNFIATNGRKCVSSVVVTTQNTRKKGEKTFFFLFLKKYWTTLKEAKELVARIVSAAGEVRNGRRIF